MVTPLPSEPPTAAGRAAAEPAQEEPVVDKGPYILPSLSLLNPLRPSAADHSDVGEMSQRLVSTLKLFGVDAELLIDHAWGLESCTMRDIKAYRPESRSRSIGQVLSRPYAFQEALTVFCEMAEQLAFDLTARSLRAKVFVFSISYDHESVDRGLYHGPLYLDFYGRLIPPHTVGTVRLLSSTSSVRQIRDALAERFQAIVPPQLLVRRIGIAAENTEHESDVWQLDLFTDYDRQMEEHDLQASVLSVRKKYGANAIVKGMDYAPGATARDRNAQIGGHKA